MSGGGDGSGGGVGGAADAGVEAVARRLALPTRQVAAVRRMVGDGATVPFMARYRQELTGGLDASRLREVLEALEDREAWEKRRDTVVKAIEGQGKMTPQLLRMLEKTVTTAELDEVYAPFKKRQKTKADAALEAGLGATAEQVWMGTLQVQQLRGDERRLGRDEVRAGLQAIVAARMSQCAEARAVLRDLLSSRYALAVKKRSKTPDGVDAGRYSTYFDFRCPIKYLKPHQVLAVNRGEAQKVLSVSILPPSEHDTGHLRIIESHCDILASRNTLRCDAAGYCISLCKESAVDAWKRLLLPSLTRAIRQHLKRNAEKHAIAVFSTNLRQLVLAPPVRGKHVLGWDPGFRHGCKTAIVDEQGRLLHHQVLFPPLQGQSSRDTGSRVAEQACEMIKKHAVSIIAIGNGTGSRESAEFVASMIQKFNLSRLRYTVVSEAGASVYSVSEAAKTEFPDLDPSVLGAISIARRLQDPLSELVKIDPVSIGVGMYQHDVSHKLLAQSAHNTIVDCVNDVGVDVNVASVHLLSHIAGLSKSQAASIYSHCRREKLTNRSQIRKVKGIGLKSYEQCAGFLRVGDGTSPKWNPLDATGIHPESYRVAEALCAAAGMRTADVVSMDDVARHKLRELSAAVLASKLDVGIPTVELVKDALIKFGRDFRDDQSAPVFRSGVKKLEDLRVGEELEGSVTNVVDFGAFVDIGVKQDGLVHRSRMLGQPLSVGSTVAVIVESVDVGRGRIGLRLPGEVPRPAAHERKHAHGLKASKRSRGSEGASHEHAKRRRPGGAAKRGTKHVGVRGRGAKARPSSSYGRQ